MSTNAYTETFYSLFKLARKVQLHTEKSSTLHWEKFNFTLKLADVIQTQDQTRW
jgi:hypothetical protein